MRLVVNLLFLTLFLGSVGSVPGAQTWPNSTSGFVKPGVVVESVAKNAEGERAGLQEGDILLRWIRGEAQGEITSPFDLIAIEIGQAPRGTVVVRGLRGNETKSWSLGEDIWQVQVRPNFSRSGMISYREGRELATAGELSTAAEKWRAMAAVQNGICPELLRTWLLFHIAEVQASNREWKASDHAYEESAGYADSAGPDIRAEVLRAWARTFEQRGRWADAEKYYRQAMETDDESIEAGLRRAADLESLGNVAGSRGDLAGAKRYHQQALDIRVKVAPESLPVAASLNDLSRILDEFNEFDNAESHATRALKIAEAVAPGSLVVANSLRNLGIVASDRGQLTKAEEYHRKSLVIRQERAPGSLAVATSLTSLAGIFFQRDELVEAEWYYSHGWEIRRKLAPASLDAAASLIGLGLVARKRKDLGGAEAYLRQALAIQQDLAPGSLDVSRTLDMLSVIFSDRGDLAKADKYLKEALELKQLLVPRGLDVAVCLSNLGMIATARMDLDQAESYLKGALDIQRQLAPGSLDLARSLHHLGRLAWYRSDLAAAARYYTQALRIQQQLAPASFDVANSLLSLGMISQFQGAWVRARDYYGSALAIQQKLDPSGFEAAYPRMLLGMISLEEGDFAQAEHDCRQALEIEEEIVPLSDDAGDSLNCLGVVSQKRAQLQGAEEYYRRALKIWEERGPASGRKAESLAGLASVLRQQGRSQEAGEAYQQALNVLDAQANRLGGSDTVRTAFRAKHKTYYHDYIELLLEQNNYRQAFEVLEGSRARTLLETLTTAHVDIRNGIDFGLIKKERSLQADIGSKSERRVRLLAEKQNAEQVKAIEVEISTLISELQDVESQIRSKNPAYAALTQPQPLSAKEIQEQLLDRDTLLLEYSLGEERSHVFVVSTDSLEAFELPNRTIIETASRRVYELLAARNRRSKNEKPAERVARIARADAEYLDAVVRLSRMVLGPVAEKLADKRLLIVSDGALHYVPFAALPVRANAKATVPLAARNEIVNLPSASVLAVLRREEMRRPGAAKTVAVLADPVFDRGDGRVKPVLVPQSRNSDQAGHHSGEAQAGNTAPEIGAVRRDVARTKSVASQESPYDEELLNLTHLTRSAADVGWKRNRRGEVYLPRLQSTRKEAEAIIAVTPAGQSFEALDFKANRTTATSADLANYRIVHFATHALLNSKHPELSGLVLSLVDERGRPQSGFLGLEDIYNLNLPAELVVLSACETALGKDIEGEGMVGLTRGFMYAGASRVMASLWNIDDRATADQMKYFYRAMVGQGMRPAAALRAAQLKMRQDPRWSSPYFWAAFQIQGEWK